MAWILKDVYAESLLLSIVGLALKVKVQVLGVVQELCSIGHPAAYIPRRPVLCAGEPSL